MADALPGERSGAGRAAAGRRGGAKGARHAAGGASQTAAAEPSPPIADDARKKRCADRSDSSESSDSGVATLSCADCGGSSASDITEPGSPSGSSGSSGGDGWRWPRTQIKTQTQSQTQTQPARRPRKRLRPLDMPEALVERVADRRKATAKPADRGGRITEYFRSQMKPTDPWVGAELRKCATTFLPSLDGNKPIAPKPPPPPPLGADAPAEAAAAPPRPAPPLSSGLNGGQFAVPLLCSASLLQFPGLVSDVDRRPRVYLSYAVSTEGDSSRLSVFAPSAGFVVNPVVGSVVTSVVGPAMTQTNASLPQVVFAAPMPHPDFNRTVSVSPVKLDSIDRIFLAPQRRQQQPRTAYVPPTVPPPIVAFVNPPPLRTTDQETKSPDGPTPPPVDDSYPASEESKSGAPSETVSTDSPEASSASGKDTDEDSSRGFSTARESPVSASASPQNVRFPVKKHSKGDSRTETKPCQWNECAGVFRDGGELLEHLQESHVDAQAGEETYRCHWIGCKVYNRPSCSRSWLERHVLSHGGTKVFRCIVDGCGHRFNTHLALQKHVNNHFNESENGSSAKKTTDGSSASKSVRKNGKKFRYRRQPWSARMFDYFDAGIMEGLQHRVVQVASWRSGGVSGKPSVDAHYPRERAHHCVAMAATILARRIGVDSTAPECLVRWTPSDVLQDEWLPEKEFAPIKRVPIADLDASARRALYSSFCDSYRPPSRKLRPDDFTKTDRLNGRVDYEGERKPFDGTLVGAAKRKRGKTYSATRPSPNRLFDC